MPILPTKSNKTIQQQQQARLKQQVDEKYARTELDPKMYKKGKLTKTPTSAAQNPLITHH